jgi:hypothetical protein
MEEETIPEADLDPILAVAATQEIEDVTEVTEEIEEERDPQANQEVEAEALKRMKMETSKFFIFNKFRKSQSRDSVGNNAK